MKPPYRYLPNDSTFTASLWEELLHLDWQEEVLILFGKPVKVPRTVAFYADLGVCYRYSGRDHSGNGWPELLMPLKAKAEALTGQIYNSVLLNHYASGEDYMGWHSDDEASLGPAPCIAMYTLGAIRDFTFRLKQQPRIKHSIELASNTWLIMEPPTQALWQHTLPKRKRVKEPRISLTFRSILKR